jgi:endonuclease YncB( thermonuclease family)
MVLISVLSPNSVHCHRIRIPSPNSEGAVTMTSIDRDRDVYGRLLRNVAVNGADVGEAMVSAGVEREYAGGRRPWC